MDVKREEKCIEQRGRYSDSDSDLSMSDEYPYDVFKMSIFSLPVNQSNPPLLSFSSPSSSLPFCLLSFFLTSSPSF